MKRFSFFVDPEQHRILNLISEATTGNPPVAGLIRDALKRFIAAELQKEHVREHMRLDDSRRRGAEGDLKPRLVKRTDGV